MQALLLSLAQKSIAIVLVMLLDGSLNDNRFYQTALIRKSWSVVLTIKVECRQLKVRSNLRYSNRYSTSRGLEVFLLVLLRVEGVFLRMNA
jgi:hypothetical protein